MESKICFNRACRATKSAEWKEGWVLRSGGFADLCHDCGTVYENSLFCETFHRDDSGWRECSGCNKRLHCGCAASRSSVELLDAGGVECIGCMRRSSQLHPNQSAENLDELRGVGTSGTDIIAGQLSNSIENRAEDDRVANDALLQMGRLLEANGSSHLLQSQNGDVKPSSLQVKREEPLPPMGQIATDFLNLTQPSNGALKYTKPDKGGLKLGLKDTYVSLAQPSLSISLKAPLGTQDFTPFLMEGKEQRKSFSSSQQGQKFRPSLPKHSKSGIVLGSETNKDTASRVRVARPPAEGRGRNQLLPRYWPRITDQELQQLSGHLNSTIVPLFEKVLSASDAGRIGRLVLPKACAEAYFPPINQSEGLPIKIQDGKGKEWTFQFRFWPNNNSRMYVLEGVTPCIQSMQLYAGDTVTFSRIDPGGKLVIGYRKASISVGMQDAETSALPNETLLGETAFSGIPTVNGYSGNFESLKGSKEDQSTNSVSGNLSLADGDNGWYRAEKFQRRENEGAVQSEAIPEKKRTRNIGSKSKRLHIHSEDAKELRLTWEEAQDLLRPAPSAKPSIVTIEDHEFEEYDEPPVFGKRTIFTVRPSGEQEQWAQCDNCSKWRSLPVDVLLPPNWTCSENVWDPQRSLCSAPDEMSPKDQEIFFRAIKGAKRRRTAEILSRTEEREPSGLDALASVAVLGENPGDLSETSVGATTKHPRHRPGCTCIVCIQPPSGKGKHKPSCACNVCTTVRRRFKTLMLRKKIRQSEREAEFSRKHQIRSEDDNDIPRIENGRSQSTPTDISFSAYYAENGKNPMDISFSVKYEEHGTNHLQYAENGRSHQSITEAAVNETGAGQIDLNYPEREEAQAEATGMSMMDLVNAAGFPLENYLRQNGLASLICEQHGSLGSSMPPAGGGEDHLGDERYIASVGWENNGTDDGHWQLNTD